VAHAKKRKRSYRKRTGYLRFDELELGVKTITIRGYDKSGHFVGRLVLNRAGVEPFVGARGNRTLGNLSWEKFFKRLEPTEK
jgi:hypothetical protein